MNIGCTGTGVQRRRGSATGKAARPVGEAGRPIRIVTLDFLANGGDGYPFRTFMEAAPYFANRQELKNVLAEPDSDLFAPPGSEQFAMAQYFATFFADTPFNQPDTPIEDDVRIQNLAFREDTVLAGLNDLVLPEPTLAGTDGREPLLATGLLALGLIARRAIGDPASSARANGTAGGCSRRDC